MDLNSTKIKMIDHIMDYFDFEKVHVYMTISKWSWWDGEGPDRVPTIRQLKEVARDLLSQAYDKKTSIQTGGFVAEYDSCNTHETLHLHFAIASHFSSSTDED